LVDIENISVPDFPKDPLVIDFNRPNAVLEGLRFSNNSFDLVHQNIRAYSFTEKQFKENVINEYIRVTKPGGWIELMVFIVLTSFFITCVFIMYMLYDMFVCFNYQEFDQAFVNAGEAYETFQLICKFIIIIIYILYILHLIYFIL
jgi:ubiquinone/menaquinone biosynthesis C-methylase UbiE